MRVRGAVVLIGLFVLVATLVTLHERRPDVRPPVRRSGAEALLRHTVRLAQAGEVNGVCETVAASRGTCEFQLNSARASGWTPGTASPRIVGATRPGPGVLVLHLRGTRLDGSTYTSEFAVMREGTDDGPESLRSLTPVYWSGVRFDETMTCVSEPGSVACGGVTSPEPARR